MTNDICHQEYDIFAYVYFSSVYFICANVYLNILLIFGWNIFILESCLFLYILNIDSLSDKYFANIPSQSSACLLILLRVSFPEQKFLIFIKSKVSVFSFRSHTIALYLKTYHKTQNLVDLSPMFSLSYSTFYI